MLLALPLYIFFDITLWAIIWGFGLEIFSDPLAWHIYSLIYGLGLGGILAFTFTAIPEMYEDEAPLKGKPLVYLFLLWLVGLAFFWLQGVFGLWAAYLSNIALPLAIIAMTSRVFLGDPQKKQIGIYLGILGIFALQNVFFLSELGFLAFEPIAVLKASAGMFVVLIILVFKRMLVETVDDILQKRALDETFAPKPFRFNLAVFSVLLYFGTAFFFPSSPVLIWLGLAAACFMLNLLNDFYIDGFNFTFKPFTFEQALAIFLAAAGFAALSADLAFNGGGLSNHLFHFFTTGVFGLGFYTAFLVIAFVHTGRRLEFAYANLAGTGLIAAACLLRVTLPFFDNDFAIAIYSASAIFWGVAFLVFFFKYRAFLTSKRPDGKDG